ncbi:unnamed protein product [Malus baccata var. baccata]
MAGEGSGFVQASIPKLDGHYDHWAMLMENFLRSKEYWTSLAEGQRKVFEDQKLKDLKAKNYLFQAIDRAVLETILNKDTAKEIWDSLKQKYQGTARVKRAQLQALRKEFEMLHMKPGETESKDLDILSIDELQSRLLVHEQRMIRHGVEEQALKVTCEENFGGRGRGRGSFRGRGRGRGRQNFDKSTVECYHCHELGHYQYECPKKDREAKANYAEASEEMLLMAYMDTHEIKEDIWFLDSGCSNHMCGKRELFSEFVGSFRETVKLGNNTSMAVLGKGNIRLQVNGMTQVIT